MIEERKGPFPREFLGAEDDVIEDLEESYKELESLRRQSKKKKLRYPSSRDVYETVKETVHSISPELNPVEFPEVVREILKSRGFYTGLITDKRIWRAYRILVAKKSIPDVLGVLG